MILDKIVEYTKNRVENLKTILSFEDIKSKAYSNSINSNFLFEQELKKKGISFICEIKRASPSKGIISENISCVQIAKEYEESGVNAISVVTEPEFFLGKDEYIKDISKNVTIPILRKDFIVDSYQIYESKVLGASAILFISSILSEKTLKEYIKIAHNLGLSALVETHNEDEILKSIKAGARIIGVNNRDLKNFEVDINTSIRLRKFVPDNILFVSESGIKDYEDIKMLSENSVDAVLIGEALMISNDKRRKLAILRGDTVG